MCFLRKGGLCLRLASNINRCDAIQKFLNQDITENVKADEIKNQKKKKTSTVKHRFQFWTEPSNSSVSESYFSVKHRMSVAFHSWISSVRVSPMSLSGSRTSHFGSDLKNIETCCRAISEEDGERQNIKQ